MNKIINCQRFKPPSEIEDRELSAESPEETLSEMQSRLTTLESIYESQSAAAEEFSESIRKKLSFGISPNIEKVVGLQEALGSMKKTWTLYVKLQQELCVKRWELL